ncbi:MAG: HlyD family secretion protein [Tepidisphaeraceae bacterium]
MFTKFVLPALAVIGVIFALAVVRQGARPVPASQPVAMPAQAPFEAYIAGAGIVEASTENIAVGTLVSGVVQKIFVKIGQDVKAGQPLFEIDDRDLQAELLVRQAAMAAQKQKLARLESLPRPEDVPRARAKVAQAQAELADAKDKLDLWEKMPDRSAVSVDEMNRRRFAVDVADAVLKQAQAELALLEAGSWKPDLEIARAEVASAEAQVKATQIAIDRLTVRAPVDGRVLQIKVRVGEFATAGVMDIPLMLLGDVKTLHVRVDVDEHDAWRLKPDAAARASLRGNKDLSTALRFVRVEPYVVPKRSLTGDSAERVDTRVLQVIYAFDRESLPVYVGQQMDVFIQAPPLTVQKP